MTFLAFGGKSAPDAARCSGRIRETIFWISSAHIFKEKNAMLLISGE
jgi:hypothetical protein